MITSCFEDKSQALSIKVKGDVLSTNAPSRSQAIADLLNEQDLENLGSLTLDLSSARIIDSVGLNMIFGLVKRLRLLDVNLKIVISSLAVQRVFSFSRLDTIVETEFKERRKRRKKV